jgi:serine/threonine protein kinase
MTKSEAIAEVSHLTRLNHAHIVRIIGTYVEGRELSILLYPVAQYNLETFIEHLQNADSNVNPGRNTQPAMHLASQSFFSCLSGGTKYIHSRFTKHMEIKPQNILIVEGHQRKYHPLIADFGIARSYESQHDIETDRRTSFTKRYAAPEVVKQDPRGLPADIFSLGCVFLEIYISIQSTPSRLNDKIHAVHTSYQANARELQSLLNKRFDLDDTFMLMKNMMPLISRMLSVRPHERPTANELVCVFGELDCCTRGQIPLQATAPYDLDMKTPIAPFAAYESGTEEIR